MVLSLGLFLICTISAISTNMERDKDYSAPKAELTGILPCYLMEQSLISDGIEDWTNDDETLDF